MPMTLRAGELMVNPLFAGTIEGAVRDEAGEPAGNVVVVVQPDPGTRMRTLAERQGLSVARVSVPADTASPTGGLSSK